MTQKRRSKARRKTRKNIVVFDTNDSLSKEIRGILNYGSTSMAERDSFRRGFGCRLLSREINLFPTTLLNAKQMQFFLCFEDDIFSTIASRLLFIAADCEYISKVFPKLFTCVPYMWNAKTVSIKSIQIWIRHRKQYARVRVFDIARMKYSRKPKFVCFRLRRDSQNNRKLISIFLPSRLCFFGIWKT